MGGSFFECPRVVARRARAGNARRHGIGRRLAIVAPALDEAGFGVLYASLGVGALLGTWLAVPTERRLGRARTLALSVVLGGASLQQPEEGGGSQQRRLAANHEINGKGAKRDQAAE